MQNINKVFLLALGLGLLGHTAHAQLGVGNGSIAPRTMLDVNGALSVTETTAAISSNAATIPTGFSLVRLTGSPTASVALTAASSPAPVAGQQLIVYNPTTQAAVLAGQSIAAGQALAFIYSNSGWQATAGGSNAPNFYTADGTLTGNRTVGLGANNLTFTSSTGRTLLSGNGNAMQGLDISNTNNGSSAHARLALSNDKGSAYLFLNSSTRTVHGPANSLTLRNDVGGVQLFSKASTGIVVAETGDVFMSKGLTVGNDNTASGFNLTNGLAFGSTGSGEGISSDRNNSGSNPYGLDFYTGQNRRMAITQGGYVGIGTSIPRCPLDVETASGSLAGNYAFFVLRSSSNQAISGTGNQSTNISIRAAGRIVGSEFNSMSDARLKTITGLSDGKHDLGILKQITITDYQMKDKAQYGDKAFKKVIAQQVEKVYPLAVTKNVGFVPSIYGTGEVATGNAGQTQVTLAAPHNLKVGDKVKVIGEKNGTVETEVMAVSSPRNFSVTLPQAETKLFVFGPQVKDLRSVDYEAIAMLNVSATQELAKQVEELKAANAKLTAANASLKTNLEEKASASTLTEMQAALQALRAEVQSLKGAGITASIK